MKSFLILFYLALVRLGAAEELNQNGLNILEQQNCGVFNENDLSLNNNEANLGSRPWMALLKIRISDKDSFACLGTLITDRFLLTAAQCAKYGEIKSVRLGEYDQSKDPDCRSYDSKEKCLPSVEDIDVERVVLHEDYKNSLGSNDIALVQLSRKVEFKEHIRPICLPLNSALQQQVESLQSMLLTGWGYDDKFSSENDVLREVIAPIADRQNCSQHLRGIKIEQSQFCSYMNGILCKGTSGAPLSKPVDYLGKQRFVQFGIVSFGSTSCSTSSLEVNTNVGSFMPWITRVLGQPL
ncbi:serine protease grass-like [Drosophila innubila]|uniref:serine protease grass-like n=1 Tax=Drosophila innubila TaxID=198719 RepID=UPI00148C2200|nr:serine protease grass-like [Drosophila innubila]